MLAQSLFRRDEVRAESANREKAAFGQIVYPPDRLIDETANRRGATENVVGE
jgi:hypothetical protein